MIHKVEKFIEQQELLQRGEKVVVAISGGADSVALLLVLRGLGYDCVALHCNFHLRQEESLRDERFVMELCKRLRTPLKVIEFNTAEYAAKKKISIEMAAREQRYEAFERYRQETGARAIAVAHHRDDSAETILLNLMRGTGIKGLRGIQPKNGYIIRPLLCVGRNDILDYLKWRREDFVTDSTNLTSDFTRNKIRLEIIPLMESINPSIINSLTQTATHLTEAEKVYAKAIEEGVERVKTGNIIDIAELRQEPSPQALLFEILQPLGFNSAQIGNIYTSLDGEGRRTFESNAWKVTKAQHTLTITSREEDIFSPTSITIGEEKETPYGTIECKEMPFDGEIERGKETASLDLSKIKEPLTIRLWQKGDRFTPFGMRGSKLVSDYMTDRKMSPIEKSRQLVITDADGDIIWLINERPASKCKIDKNTKRIVRIKWTGK